MKGIKRKNRIISWVNPALLFIISFGFFLSPRMLPAEELRVEIQPNPAVVETGGTLRLELRAFDPSGSSVDGRVKWMVIPKTLGSITEEGLFQAGPSTGKGIVRATLERGKAHFVGHTLLRVEQGGTVRRITVRVSPEEVSLSPGGTHQFGAKVSTLEGRPLEGEVTWRVLPQGIGRITPEGFLSVEGEGEGKIVARARTGEGEGVGFARIRISRGEGIALNPSFVLIKPGESQSFKVEILNKSLLPEPPKILWKVDPPGLGIVNEEGIFKAGSNEGRGSVIAEVGDGEITAVAQITISKGGEKQLIVKVLPKEISLSPGEMRKFEVTVTKPDGTPVDADLQWQVIPDRLGILTQEGSFTAGFEILTGQIGVYAKSEIGEGLDISHIRILQRQIRVEIQPSSISLRPNEGKQLVVKVWDEENNSVDPPLLLWTVEPAELGTMEEGFFQAGSSPMAGEVRVRVPPEMGFGEGRVQILITSIQWRRDRFEVNIQPPTQVPLRPYETHQFFVNVYDTTGSTINDPPIFWSVDKPHLGEITQEGLFTAKMPPHGDEQTCRVFARIESKFGAGEDHADVRITPILRRRGGYNLNLTPQHPTIHVNTSLEFNAYVVDRQGIQVNATFEWGVEGNIGTIRYPSDGETIIFEAGPEPGRGSLYVIAHPTQEPDYILKTSTTVTVLKP